MGDLMAWRNTLSGPVVFLDTETTGLDESQDQPWEVAWCRREADGTETRGQRFIRDPWERGLKLPEPFRTDYITRYRPNIAIDPGELAETLAHVFRGRAHLVGAVPTFDVLMLTPMLNLVNKPRPWHYHITDVEHLAIGWICSRLRYDTALIDPEEAQLRQLVTTLPINSDALSRAIEVDPAKFDRHTAAGDVEWARAIFDVVGPPALSPNWL